MHKLNKFKDQIFQLLNIIIECYFSNEIIRIPVIKVIICVIIKLFQLWQVRWTSTIVKLHSVVSQIWITFLLLFSIFLNLLFCAWKKRYSYLKLIDLIASPSSEENGGTRRRKLFLGEVFHIGERGVLSSLFSPYADAFRSWCGQRESLINLMCTSQFALRSNIFVERYAASLNYYIALATWSNKCETK